MLWRRAGIASLVLSAAVPAAALDPARPVDQYSHDAWTLEHGLPLNTVQALAQTRDGLVWIGTPEGLSRFDGTRFRNYDASNVPAMRTSDVVALLVARDGTLWVGVYGSGLLKSVPGGGFVAVGGRELSSLAALAEDASGVLYAGTSDRGIYRVAGDGVEPFSVPGFDPASSVTALRVDRMGRVWAGTSRGLFRLDPSHARLFGQAEGLPSPQVLSLEEDSAGRLWVGTSLGLGRVEGESVTGFEGRVPVGRSPVYSLREDRGGTLWVGSEEGLVRWQDGGAFRLLQRDALTDTSIRALMDDRDGSLWIGTFNGGVNMLADGPITSYTPVHGLATEGVGSVASASDGGLWVALADGLVQRVTPEPWQAGRRLRSPDGSDVYTLLEDRARRVWIGSDTGVFVYGSGAWKALGEKDGVPRAGVTALYEDRDGVVWVGYDARGAVSVKGGRGTPLPGLPNLQVRAFLQGRDGTLYVATYGGLVAVSGGKARVYTEADGLSSQYARSLYEDASGALWIGSYGSGLSRLRDGRLQKVTSRDGLFSDVVYGIAEDASGWLWMSCNRGLFSVRRAELEAFFEGRVPRVTSRHYGRSDGMLSVECNGGSPPVARTADGRLWFPTSRGLVEFDGRRLRPRGRLPAPLLDEALLDGRELACCGGLLAPPHGQRLELRWTAPGFLDADRLRFAFRLDPYESEWNAAGARRRADYTRLPPGDYTFRVRSSDDDGSIGGEASLAVRIEPQWWQTRAFLAAVALGLVAVVGGAYSLRIRALRRGERELQRRVEAALSDVRVLSGLLPICANCKKIRDDKGYWSQIESYIREHSEAHFTHGICPDCARQLYPNLKATSGTPRPQ
jgi:ligand-binding sensor domain-containing protein